MSFGQRSEPVHAQALVPQAAVEGLDEAAVRLFR